MLEELENAARALGMALSASEPVQRYRQAVAECETDSQASELEAQLYAMYDELISRQQRGEIISRNEVEAFNALKRRVYQQPRIREREAALMDVKRYFVQIADEINFPLGVDFALLARAAQEE
jgi:cell fate (sporulation/competence/biofilm development) regulator YlbF (YheA/YmcA/DUF963 family)